MNMVNCPRCHGASTEVSRGLTGIDGDTSYDDIDCKTCGGIGRVPAAWAAAFDETGLESRCDTCRATRPCAIMESPTRDIVIVCAKCAAAMETAGVVEEAAS